MFRYKPAWQTAGQPQRVKGNQHQPTWCLTELTGSLMLIQTYKRLVSRRGTKQSVMHAYWGPVEVQMTRSWCSARLSGPHVGALNILSYIFSLFVNQHLGKLPWVYTQWRGAQLSFKSLRWRKSKPGIGTDLSFCVCVMCLCHAKLVRMAFFPIPAPSSSFFFPPPRCVWMPRAPTGIFTHNEVTPYHPPPPLLSVIYLHQ